MPISSVSGVKIAGISAAVPEQRVSNMDFEHLLIEDRQKMIKSTGIQYRHIVPKGMFASDLCFAATEKLIEELQWRKDEVEALIFVTQSADYPLPATSIILQDRLGFPKSCIAFDINLGCSGYPYGLSIICSMMSSMKIKKGIFIIGDNLSRTTNLKDRSSVPLFGDAGTATALEFDDSAPDMLFNLSSDGSGYKAIIIPQGTLSSRSPATANSFIDKEVDGGMIRNGCNIALDGVEIFNFGIREAPKTVKGIMDKYNVNEHEIDAFVFHQANMLMNEMIRKKLKIPAEKVPYTLSKYGNTSSATIPLTIVSELREKITSQKMKMLLCGFGVGLSWATAIVDTDSIACPEVIQL